MVYDFPRSAYQVFAFWQKMLCQNGNITDAFEGRNHLYFAIPESGVVR